MNHQCFGGSSFIEVAIGTNAAVSGIAHFRSRLEGLNKRLDTKLQAKFATAIDQHRGVVAAIEKHKKDTENDAVAIFRWFSRLSFISIVYGITLLYFDGNHCSNIFMILVWPAYLFVVRARSVWMSGKIQQKLDAYLEISNLSKLSLEEELKKLTNDVSGKG